MNFKKAKKEIEKGIIRPFYIFVGEEREIMKKYMEEIDPNYKVVKTLAEVIPLMNSKTVMQQKFTFVVKDDKEGLKASAEDLEKAAGKHTLVLIYQSLDKVCKLGKTAEEYLFEFDRVKNAGPYVQKFIDVSDSFAKKIADRCGHDIRRIELEVEKLQMLEDNGHKITGKLIDEIIVPLPKNKIWDFIDNIVSKKDINIWAMLKDLKELGQTEVQLIGALYNSVKQLFLVFSYENLEDKEVAKKTGLQTWQIKKSRKLIYNDCSKGEILEDMRRINKLENDIKFGRVDAELGFKNLIMDLIY